MSTKPSAHPHVSGPTTLVQLHPSPWLLKRVPGSLLLLPWRYLGGGQSCLAGHQIKPWAGQCLGQQLHCQDFTDGPSELPGGTLCWAEHCPDARVEAVALPPPRAHAAQAPRAPARAHAQVLGLSFHSHA